jgi:hypothetical protein
MALPASPILDWWIFEGQRYRGLRECLALEWPAIARQARYLLATHNPRWRPLQTPEGEVDWLSTAFATATSGQPSYVCRTSMIGLNDDERAALRGWQTWTAIRWQAYCEALGAPPGAVASLPWPATPDEPVSDRQLRRWAFIARRSRWPLLRSVVAESLRAVFEPQAVARLPLPTEPSRLFELVCLVRVLRSLNPYPTHIRWIDTKAPGNEIVIAGVRCAYQYSIPRDEMLASSEFDGGLREAVVRHDVGAPRYIDALFLFDPPKEGFAGLLLEAKSGAQDYRAAVFQLKCYKAVLAERLDGRLIAWGVFEREPDGAAPWSAVRERLTEERRLEAKDLWLFSPASAIPEAMRAIGFSSEPASANSPMRQRRDVYRAPAVSPPDAAA